MTQHREALSWEQFGDASRHLATRVWESGFFPDIIVCVARGGLIPAGAMAYALNIKSLLVLNVEFYTGVGTVLPDPRLVDPIPAHHGLRGRRVLIVDDVADSGRTLQFVQDICAEYTDQIRIAVLYEKPGSRERCDFSWETTDAWVSFPWSSLPPVTGEPNPDN